MVNNSTNINKTKNHFSLHITEQEKDHKIYHLKYVNNSTNNTKVTNQSALTSNHRTQKTPQHMLLKIKVMAWDRHKNMTGLNRLMGYIS